MATDIFGREIKEDRALLSRRERKKQNQKYAIIRAAQQLIEAKGYDATSVNEIAETADIAYGTFFNHFPSKEAMLLFIAQVEYEDLQKVMNVRFSETDPAAAVLEGVFLEWCDDSIRHRNVSARLEEVIMRNNLSSNARSVHQLLVYILRHGVQRGEFRSDIDCDMVAYMLEGIRHVSIQTGSSKYPEILFYNQLREILVTPET